MDGQPASADVEASTSEHFRSVAEKNWLETKTPVTRAVPNVIRHQLWDRLEQDKFTPSSVSALESLQCFEKYLWPSFNENSSNYHALLLVLLLNHKYRDGLPSWTLLSSRPSEFSAFFRRILGLLLDESLPLYQRQHVLVAIISAFQSLENGLIRKECAPLVSISIWHNLHSAAFQHQLLEENAQFKKAWRAATKKYEAADENGKVRLHYERSWLYSLILEFLGLLHGENALKVESRLYCERFLEFLTDLQSQFPTRRYVNTLLKDLNVLVILHTSPVYHSADGGLIRDFYTLLKHYTYFPIDDQSGREYTEEETAELNDANLARLQRFALKHYKDQLKLLVLETYGALRQRTSLLSHLEALGDDDLHRFATLLGFRTSYPSSMNFDVDRKFVLEILLSDYEKKEPYQQLMRSMHIMPNESLLYNESFLRNEQYNGARPVALPKLNLQYLTNSDFLWRSFILYRCETFYEIRTYLEEQVKRLHPRSAATSQTKTNSSRMTCKISKPAIIEVTQPKVGEDLPQEVKAEVILDTSRMSEIVRKEWESLRLGDVVFLLGSKRDETTTLRVNGSSTGSTLDHKPPYKLLRSAEVLQVLDEHSRPLRFADAKVNGNGQRPRQRRLLLKMDSAAHASDTMNASKGQSDVYESIDVIVRRKARENNFRPILESIRWLATSNVRLPLWLQDVFLGLGDPTSANYKHLSNAFKRLDFRDTFLNWQHLVESLPQKTVRPNEDAAHDPEPPFILEETVITAEGQGPSSRKKRRQNGEIEAAPTPNTASTTPSGGRIDDTSAGKSTRSSKKRRRDEMETDHPVEAVEVSTYTPPNQGPYPADAPHPNQVRFTPAQVDAIISGTQPGLTVIVGPPGTGKTDVATQIINNIYHNFPQERTLLVAHSNQALNQLFQKIAVLDIDQRHLLRLGQGERELQLESEAGYSKQGRVEYFLDRGAQLLAEVNRLAASVEAPGSHGNSCETADYFNVVYVQPLWTRYQSRVLGSEGTVQEIVDQFPFHVFFSNTPEPLFPDSVDAETARQIAWGCYRHISNIFTSLQDIRPFEVLRNDRQKSNYLLVKEARVIAMTSTHAAMHQHEIANLGFRYNNVIMEEAAQITEIEGFIPFVLQQPFYDEKQVEMPLKRVVLCGDHLQNSPVVQNAAFRQYAHFDQSLFLRLIRLGVPHTLLDAQGRARASLCELYKWRYDNLSNLPTVLNSPEFLQANAGFRWDHQFIDVGDYKDKGETTPSPHFIQNLGEAEYAVALYMYMRLLGYPAEKISILTTYAGQRALLRDVLEHRCKGNRLFGMPRTVATVDKYQGEQNDYIILSLVRTRDAGFLRDVRRLTVALSRARLGLYILGRRSVFESAPELQPAFELLSTRPQKLQLVVDETFPTDRDVSADVDSVEMEGVEHLGQYVFEMTQAKIRALKEGGGMLPPPASSAKVLDDDDEEEQEHEVVDGEDPEDDDMEGLGGVPDASRPTAGSGD